MKNSFIFLIQFLLTFRTSECSTIVQTKSGPVEGFKSLSTGGRAFTSFVGIPYAKPPTGSLRFQKPQPAEPWTETKQVTKYVVCSQYENVRLKAVIGVEDCLVANVYVPDGKSANQPLPVMVFIHGGGFFIGSGSNSLYGPERFMDYDVILVTINYRVALLGFLSTSDDVMPGNLGLWDQNLALRWVQNNIVQFGGDPNKVTIFGESAGAMSVMLHYLSPQSRGLFHAAIAQSGVATSSLLKLDKNPIYYARSIAAIVGCTPEATSREILECLQKIDVETIQKLSFEFTELEFFPLAFKPIIDDFSTTPFVPKDPWELIESGKFNQVPLIIGNNNDEGLLSAYNVHTNQTLFQELSRRWSKELGPTYMFYREIDEIDENTLEISKTVSQHFFNGKDTPDQDDILTGLKEIVGDTMFGAIGSVTARKIAQKTELPVYEYLYKYQGSLSFSRLMNPSLWKLAIKIAGQYVGLNLFPPSEGVCHFDEMFLLFKQHLIPLDGVFTEQDKITSRNLLQLWTDFARTGNPTPDSSTSGVKWERLSSENHQRLEIGAGTLSMELDEKLEERINFWTSIWAKLPTNGLRLESSPTWKNKMLYRKRQTEDASVVKEEL